jgi:hypothetical protein
MLEVSQPLAIPSGSGLTWRMHAGWNVSGVILMQTLSRVLLPNLGVLTTAQFIRGISSGMRNIKGQGVQGILH